MLHGITTKMNFLTLKFVPKALLDKMESIFYNKMSSGQTWYGVNSFDQIDGISKVYAAAAFKADNQFVQSLKAQCDNWIQNGKYDFPLSRGQINCAVKIYVPKAAFEGYKQ